MAAPHHAGSVALLVQLSFVFVFVFRRGLYEAVCQLPAHAARALPGFVLKAVGQPVVTVHVSSIVPVPVFFIVIVVPARGFVLLGAQLVEVGLCHAQTLLIRRLLDLLVRLGARRVPRAAARALIAQVVQRALKHVVPVAGIIIVAAAAAPLSPRAAAPGAIRAGGGGGGFLVLAFRHLLARAREHLAALGGRLVRALLGPRRTRRGLRGRHTCSKLRPKTRARTAMREAAACVSLDV
mmetsp:Transcript_31177/g.78085  ORF Transcript_31177/g.78085 Transcript_31177/m.78085 type:complete len:238 (+) Transcript_31177:1339-2052(+)